MTEKITTDCTGNENKTINGTDDFLLLFPDSWNCEMTINVRFLSVYYLIDTKSHYILIRFYIVLSIHVEIIQQYLIIIINKAKMKTSGPK